jgi:gliding motility-associated-like protein
MDPEKVSLKNPVITFTSTTVGDNLTYEWNTDDGNTYNTPSFTHTYADSGEYNVVLKVTNEYTCFDSLILKATVTPKYLLRIPSAFTPNGDGINDNFTVMGNGVMKYSINIYNRWGSLIYESKNITQSWDGRINGQPAPPGMYVYRTYFMDENEEVSEQQGSFTLIR